MKALIEFNDPFQLTADCLVSEKPGTKIILSPGQYLVEVTETEEEWVIKHETFSISVPREFWDNGTFFIDNHIVLKYR